jgi:hypothetical protein
MGTFIAFSITLAPSANFGGGVGVGVSAPFARQLCNALRACRLSNFIFVKFTKHKARDLTISASITLKRMLYVDA